MTASQLAPVLGESMLRSTTSEASCCMSRAYEQGCEMIKACLAILAILSINDATIACWWPET